MNDVFEERKREEERSKKLMKSVDKTGEEFKAEMKRIISVEEHIEKAEKHMKRTDVKARETERKMAGTERQIQKTHEKIAKSPGPRRSDKEASGQDKQ